MYRIVVLVSGGGTNLQAIIDQIAAGKLPGVEITGVIASRAGIGACARADQAGIPWTVVRKKDYSDIAAYDQAMLNALSPWQPDLIVLAGFLSLIGPDVINRYPNRIINIHPALIPSFCGPGLYGLHVHEAALAYGVKLTGATVHLVDEAYDRGPIVMQKAVPVLPEDTPEILQQRVMQQAEQIILPKAIAYFAAGHVSVNGRTVQIEEEE